MSEPLELAFLFGGWTAFSTLSVFVMRAISTGNWVPLRTQLREAELKEQQIAMMTQSRDEWRMASEADRNNVSLLLEGQRLTGEFFQKVPVNTVAQGG